MVGCFLSTILDSTIARVSDSTSEKSSDRSQLAPMQWHSCSMFCWCRYPYKMNFFWMYLVYVINKVHFRTTFHFLDIRCGIFCKSMTILCCYIVLNSTYCTGCNTPLCDRICIHVKYVIMNVIMKKYFFNIF